MPFYTVTTSLPLQREKKELIASTIIKLTVDHLKVAPDKVQVVIKSSEKENFSRAGFHLDRFDFSVGSRKINGSTTESYFTGKEQEEDLFILELDIWHNFSVEEKSKLGKDVTEFLKENFFVPGDNVLILVRDMIPDNWIQNGVSGGESNFLEKSRKI